MLKIIPVTIIDCIEKKQNNLLSQQSDEDKSSGTRAELAVRVKTRPSVFCLGPEGGVVACQQMRSRPPRTYDNPRLCCHVDRFVSDTVRKCTDSNARSINIFIYTPLNDHVWISNRHFLEKTRH